MRDPSKRFLREHESLTRRYFMGLGAAGLTALQSASLHAEEDATEPEDRATDGKQPIVSVSETWLTAQDNFQDVSRGNPKPHSLNEEERSRVGLTRDTWKLNVIADPESPAELRNPLSKDLGNAFDFAQLMELAATKSVRFAKIMTCLNIGCPLGNGIWEGVPMREVLWKTQPQKDLRRVVYFGYHNEKPEQMFRSSLPVGRVLEDPFGLPPVILCYKLNGHFLSPERGGPVRVVVPEAYGFKSIKWLSDIYLSNLSAANDTYAEKNNDVDSHLKTFCEILSIHKTTTAQQRIPISGYAQVGISGLKKVQVSVQESGSRPPREDVYFESLDWVDATILRPPHEAERPKDIEAPNQWGGDLAMDQIPDETMGFDADGRPKSWPIRLSKAHWAILLPGLRPGKYIVRCRTVDDNGIAQPLPRPFRKSGRAHIDQTSIEVTE